MGFWKKLGKGVSKGIDIATQIAPVLPIPSKAKRVIAKVGETQDDVGAIVDEFKKPKPVSDGGTTPKP